ncbi:MAG TPA: L,D-transpeptidase family protein [Candidatus Sulfotelmatobacter sp.]|nr:L,D-transpeptidase family protein [Candidatus Sulfotelmatobacter sp.]
MNPRRYFLPTLKLMMLAFCLVASFGVPVPELIGRPSDASVCLRDVVAAGTLMDLRRPNFSDYQTYVISFYEPSAYALAWIQRGKPTPQARTLIEVLEDADGKGLHAEDYDGPRWPGRLARLQQPASDAELARFDATLTVCAMRYVSDLRIGRVNPRHLKFNLEVAHKAHDLVRFLREDLISSADVQGTLARVEPPFAGYRRTLEALHRYVGLAREDSQEQLPVPSRTVAPGGSYEGTPGLIRRLRLLGDFPPGDAAGGNSRLYEGPLVTAVKHFQERHGLAPNGRLDSETLKELNVPLSFRVEQIRLTLERWRWVPHSFTAPPIVVNIPEFRLRAFADTDKVALRMNVIVGKAYRHQTPVFEQNMRYVVFRPYWNVPPSIQRSEIVPAIRRDRAYVTKRNYEVITPQGTEVTSGEISDDVLAQLSAGKLRVRQKPGPSNALGLVKLMFPNEYNIYLHSTPAPELFAHSRRDFSHGCIRVEKPAELAAWALRGNPEWTLERVRAAMQSGKNDVQVNLSTPIPVLILYGTAVVDDQNEVHFFDDLYGHDKSLEKVLLKGYPYPR